MISATLMMGAGVFGIGFGIGFVWGELKASQDHEYVQRRESIKQLRREQNSIVGNKSDNEKNL